MEHTREPWKIRGFYGFGVDSTRIGVIKVNNNHKEAQANATRIVTCVNSCAGLSNEEVERYGPERQEVIRIVMQYIAVCPFKEDKEIAEELLSRIEGKESG